MATSKRTKEFPDFLGRRDADDPRDRFIRKPLAAAQQAAFVTSVNAFKFMAALPDALAAARARELKRLEAAGRLDRAQRLAATASAGQAEQIKKVAALAQNRATRLLTSFGADEAVFQGFVSDESLAPLEHMTVRLVLADMKGDDTRLSATTADDGHFEISLDVLRDVAPLNGSEKRIHADASHDRDEAVKARVEILDSGGKLVHRDPTAIALRPDRRVYREYFVAAHGGSRKGK